MTRQPAKIGFLYQDIVFKNKKDKNSRNVQQNIKKEMSPSRLHTVHSKNVSTLKKKDKEVITQKKNLVIRKVEDKNKSSLELSEKKSFWPEDIVEKAKQWLDDVLKTMHSDKTYSVSVNRYHLKIKFDTPFFEDRLQEKNFFRALSYLMLQAQRSHLKKLFKFHKVVLLSPEQSKGN